MNILTL